MKKIISLLSLLALGIIIITSCGDPNDDFDMRSPQATLPVDTFEVTKGGIITIKATLMDESGLESCVLSYDNWKMSKQVLLRESGYPIRYEFSTEVAIPVDAATSWEENYQKNDGTIFRITQTYHKLSLTFYDAVKNKNVVYFYVKVL